MGFQCAKEGRQKAIQPKVKNLSGNGIALMLDPKSPIVAGDRIQASISLDSGQMIQAEGHVVRKYPGQNKQEDVAAVHLNGMSNRDTDVLVRYLLGLQAQRRRYQPQAA